MKKLFLILCPFYLFALEIVQRPIIFSEKRVELTKQYIKNRYGLEVNSIKIKPKMIVVHFTGFDDLELSYSRFYPERLHPFRKDIIKASRLNVSAHFLVARNGVVYQLMPDNYMARHVIGLNYSAIGIENVGGEGLKDNLTKEQLKANVELIRYLQDKYPAIEHLIGHFEYRDYENHPLWLELDEKYRTEKIDPSKRFMDQLKAELLKRE